MATSRIAKSSQLPISPGASAGWLSIFHPDDSAALRLVARHNNASVRNLAVAAANVLKECRSLSEWRWLLLQPRRTGRRTLLSPPVSESPPAFRLHHLVGLIRPPCSPVPRAAPHLVERSLDRCPSPCSPGRRSDTHCR